MARAGAMRTALGDAEMYTLGSDPCHDRTAEWSLAGRDLSRRLHVSLCEAWRAPATILKTSRSPKGAWSIP